jgi:Family of unknown function (DUF6188)
MTCDLDWLIGRPLVEVIIQDGPSWGFRFGDGTEVRADSPWRLIRSGRIVLCSEDHGQRYGHSSPIEAAVTCRTMLGGAVVQTAKVRDGTRDIIIDFESGDRLEVIPLSSGFESWQIAAPGGMITIAQGGGNLVAWWADD